MSGDAAERDNVDEFATTNRFEVDASSTIKYPSADQPTPDPAPPPGPAGPWTHNLPNKAIAVGALMALVPFTLAAALFLGLASNDVPRRDGAVANDDLAIIETNGSDTSVGAETTEQATTEETTTTSGPTTTATIITAVADSIGDRHVYPDGITSVDLDTAAGSGCSPGQGSLPDGVWFGRIVGVGPNEIEFDLMCAYTGAAASEKARALGEVSILEVLATNSTLTTRSISISGETTARTVLANRSLSTPMSFDAAFTTGITTTLGWLYINGRQLTEFVMVSAGDAFISGKTDARPLFTSSVPNGCEILIASFERVEVFGIPANDPDGGLNLRSQPRLDSAVLDTAPNGSELYRSTQCQADNNGYIWSLVDLDGRPAWAASDYLRLK